jgi:hypothetical protein
MYKESFRVRLANWLLRGAQESDSSVNLGRGLVGATTSKGRPSLDRHDGTINFTIHPASGGYVVETSYYDRQTDDHKRNLHIITSQEDFSEELGKAVFMDLLKNR